MSVLCRTYILPFVFDCSCWICNIFYCIKLPVFRTFKEICCTKPLRMESRVKIIRDTRPTWTDFFWITIFNIKVHIIKFPILVTFEEICHSIIRVWYTSIWTVRNTRPIICYCVIIFYLFKITIISNWLVIFKKIYVVVRPNERRIDRSWNFWRKFFRDSFRVTIFNL